MQKRKTPRNPKYLQFIRFMPCKACEKPGPSEAAHVRMGNGGGMGLKPSDYRTVPLCRDCHAYQHHIGERLFWEEMQKDPHAAIFGLMATWALSRCGYEATCRAIEDLIESTDER